MAKLKLTIEGMACENCVKKVISALDTMPGVSKLNVQIGKATMEIDGVQATEEKVLSAIIDAGFTAKVKKGLF